MPWPDGRGLKTIVTKTTQASPSGVAGSSTRTITVTDKHNNIVEVSEDALTNEEVGWRTISRELHTYDQDNRLVQIWRNGVVVLDNVWDDIHLTSRTDENGSQTLFEYDDLGRLFRETKMGTLETASSAAQLNIATEYTYDAADRVLTVRRTGGDFEVITSKTYDLGGRVLTSTDEAGLVTSFSYSTDELTDYHHSS